MNKKILITIIVVALVGIPGYFWFAANNQKPANIIVSPNQTGIEYTNNQYGFSFALPKDWKDYSIATSTWEGWASGLPGNVLSAQGPIVSIRYPNWTAQNLYQDNPIMIFTLSQWNSLESDQFHIGAAPINPSELGQNSKYVFALPARYNYAYPTGWQEVQNILSANPLKTF